ncbi:MAG: hypothetical protein NXI25_10945, partial [bacterium]|nr:hypothetical protein [bacterium]
MYGKYTGAKAKKQYDPKDSLRLCLERVRHENQGIVPACCASMAGRVLAKSFLARLAGVYIQTFIIRA